ncbi:hypothetical protein [Trichothermofontia sp.]
MQQFHLWLRGIAIASRQDPPRFIELMMLSLAMVSLIAWSAWESGYFLVLCVSYIVGSSTSILVRETIAPSPNSALVRCIVGVSALIALLCLYIARSTILPLGALDHLTQTNPIRQ